MATGRSRHTDHDVASRDCRAPLPRDEVCATRRDAAHRRRDARHPAAPARQRPPRRSRSRSHGAFGVRRRAVPRGLQGRSRGPGGARSSRRAPHVRADAGGGRSRPHGDARAFRSGRRERHDLLRRHGLLRDCAASAAGASALGRGLADGGAPGGYRRECPAPRARGREERAARVTRPTCVWARDPAHRRCPVREGPPVWPHRQSHAQRGRPRHARRGAGLRDTPLSTRQCHARRERSVRRRGGTRARCALVRSSAFGACACARGPAGGAPLEGRRCHLRREGARGGLAGPAPREGRLRRDGPRGPSHPARAPHEVDGRASPPR